MKKIITLSGVSVANDALPRVSATAAERTLASIPNLLLWMQAGARFETSTGFKDRAHGHALDTSAPPENQWTRGTFTGGATAMVGPDSAAANYEVPAGVEVDPDRWSVAVVAEIPSTVASTNHGLIGLPRSYVDGDIALRMSFSASNTVRIYGATGLETRISHAGGEWIDAPALIVATFSVENGLSLRVNGAQVAAASADLRPLTDGSFHIGQSTVSAYHINTFAGKLGHLLMFNADLSAVENAGYLAALEAVLMTEYGI